MPKKGFSARAVTSFSAQERKQLFYKARLIAQQPAFDMRAVATSHPFGRLIVVTPKKMGNAPKRNLIRRRLKAIFYEERLFEKRVDVILYCKKEALELPYDELNKLLVTLVETAYNTFYAHDTH